MVYNSRSFPWGDYPGLNAGPKSAEHENRFLKRGDGGLSEQNSVATEKSSASESNSAKYEDSFG